MKMLGSAIKDVAVEFEKHKGLPFPVDSEDDRASELRAELIEYDSHIAGLITTLLGGGSLTRGQLMSNDDLRYRLESLVHDSTGTVAAEGREYLKYLGHIEVLVDLLKRQLQAKT
jgi:hypothetical protein